jgi:sortase A
MVSLAHQDSEARRPADSGEISHSPALRTRGNGFWCRAEQVFLIAGIIMLSAYAFARLHSHLSSGLALQSFARSHPTGLQAASSPGASNSTGAVDFSIWSPKRIQAYRDSLATKLDQPVAVLRIPKLRIEVPVFEGTDNLTLNRGVGRINETARIGARGNTGIAGHRDSFFRGLKNIAVGDALELVTSDKTIHYAVEEIEIVQPENVAVLADRGAPSLTLVTCFPFYFVGDAPQRFIVHAKSLDFDAPKEFPGALSTQINTKEKVN